MEAQELLTKDGLRVFDDFESFFIAFFLVERWMRFDGTTMLAFSAFERISLINCYFVRASMIRPADDGGSIEKASVEAVCYFFPSCCWHLEQICLKLD